MFDKIRCIENIYKIAKEKGIKIGELEEKAGISKGYLSRVTKPDYQGSPSIEVLDSIANQLEVGIDFIVNYSHDALTPNEEFVAKFIDKITRRTMAGKVEWIPETSSILNAEDNSEVDNPMVSVTRDYSAEENCWYDCHVYRSRLFEGRVRVNDLCYHAVISARSVIYINAVQYYFRKDGKYGGWDEESGIFELYLVNGNSVQPLCSSYYVDESIKDAIRNLYAAIASVPSRIALTHSMKSELQEFINLED